MLRPLATAAIGTIDANCLGEEAGRRLFWFCWIRLMHRFLALILSLVLVAALSLQAARATEMTVESLLPAAAHMSGDCDGCPEDQTGMTPVACYAHCAGLIALPCASVELDPVRGVVLFDLAGPDLSGRTDSPDPHPPRSAVLS